jgi:hypothetical protein
MPKIIFQTSSMSRKDVTDLDMVAVATGTGAETEEEDMVTVATGTGAEIEDSVQEEDIKSFR